MSGAGEKSRLELLCLPPPPSFLSKQAHTGDRPEAPVLGWLLGLAMEGDAGCPVSGSLTEAKP